MDADGKIVSFISLFGIIVIRMSQIGIEQNGALTLEMI